ncbi:N-acetylglucosamine-induced protein 1 [Cyphellophora attinorum]|uniref:N-acetylglucosamine-induced protein 1 n=1 Tax=Cyphellophora attinorum TaxID=1664694 RepID=A0A0N0NLH0_9EURO|nr:N-acetylglucosamine-induced protein 1 [Phialophora attinorum]KPI39291.1 N-acetylglucosamine-induced protein 1 [Phialophora attinorum]
MTIGTQDAPLPFNLTDLDRQILAQTDEEFHAHSWDELKEIISTNRLDILKRKPSELRRYLKWSTETKAQYGSVPNYVMEERLKWNPLPSTTPETGPKFSVQDPTPFANSEDYRIMPNDWPYGMEDGIRHLIVWLKGRVETEPSRGDMTPKSRQQIQHFVQKTFIDRVEGLPGPAEKVMWFKNWTALQSVPGMEHIHVLVRDVPQEIIDEWTGGEPMKQDEGS